LLQQQQQQQQQQLQQTGTETTTMAQEKRTNITCSGFKSSCGWGCGCGWGFGCGYIAVSWLSTPPTFPAAPFFHSSAHFVRTSGRANKKQFHIHLLFTLAEISPLVSRTLGQVS